MSKFSKLKNQIKDNINIFRNFGLKYGINNFFETIICRNNVNTKLGAIAHKKTYSDICYLLNKKYGYIIDKYQKIKKENENFIDIDSYIFIMWWQGIEKIPVNICLCLESVKEKNPNSNICIIDKDNYNKYIELPKYIIDKFDRGIISITELSDILRTGLLSKYGGIWLDATFLVTKPFDKQLKKLHFYTLKHGLYSYFHVCGGKWTVGFMAVGENSIFAKYMFEFLCEYWREENVLICYLLLDCIISLGYENIEYIRKEIDSVPKNNSKTFELEKYYSLPYNDDVFKKFSDTYIYRLTYKLKFKKIFKGRSTLYNELYKKYIK